MANSNNKHSAGFISSSFGVAKKLSRTGVKVLNRIVQQDTIPSSGHRPEYAHAVNQQAKKSENENQTYTTPQQLLRYHVPKMSQQLLGRHYQRAHQVTHLFAPEWADQISDYLFEHLNQISSRYASVDRILDEAGAAELEELTQDVQRSKRLSQALSEKNKWLAVLQGAASGATGVVGSTVDVPASIAFALRTIYQTGRAYGFALSQTHEQEVVHYIFRQVNLALISEKQTVLLGLKAMNGLLQRHDPQQLQQLLGSNHDAEVLKQWLMQEDGRFKWQWLNQVPKVNLLGKLTPVAAAGVGAVYSWKLIDEAHQKAQHVFAGAREYLAQHQDSPLSPLGAYEASVRLLAKASPLLGLSSAEKTAESPSQEVPSLEPQQVDCGQNPTIAKIEIHPKKTEKATADQQVEKLDQVQQGIGQLAANHVTPHEPVEPQKPAIPVHETGQTDGFEVNEDIEEELVIRPVVESVKTDETQPDKTQP